MKRAISFVLGLCACASVLAAPEAEHKLVQKNGQTFVQLTVDGKPIVLPEGNPLFSKTDCSVKVTSQAVPEGCLLNFTIANPTAAPADMPDITVGQVALPHEGSQLIENWKNIRFKGTGKRKRPHHYLHAVRRYPADMYSPIMGVRGEKLFVAAAMMYDPMASLKEVHLDYLYDAKADRWTFLYRFWDKPGQRKTFVDQETGEKRVRNVLPPVAQLAPGQTVSVTVALTVAEPDGDKWVTAYRPYRDFFRQTYGQARFKSTGEPIFARSYGISRFVSEENPQGYGTASAGDGEGRLDLKGWTGLHPRVMRDAWAYGFRRMMIWQVAGSYRKHPASNMVWEIGTGQSEIAQRTGPAEIKKLAREGFTMGFWWGRAFSPTGGVFDDGIRRPLEPDNPEHIRLARRELDIAWNMGVRLIGFDASPHSVQPRRWNPSLAAYQAWLPKLYRWYPEMQWITETAACDIQHVWGGSFMWSRDVSGPCTFATYLIPGSETNVTVKRNYGRTDQAWVDQLIRWGYVPIVFNDGFNFTIRSEVLGTDDPHRYLDLQSPEATVKSLLTAAAEVEKLKNVDLKSAHPTDARERHKLVAWATLSDPLQKTLTWEKFAALDFGKLAFGEVDKLSFADPANQDRHGRTVELKVTSGNTTRTYRLTRMARGGQWAIDRMHD